jgi:hypothetical protein
MAYKASDYPQVKRASEAYDVAKAARLKAQRAFDETSTKSPNYAKVKAALATAKAAEAAKLKAYKAANDAAKADYNKKATVAKSTADARSLNSLIESLNEQITKAKDSGQDTKALDDRLKASEKKLADALAAKKTATTGGRPIGVPRTAKFNAVTGQYTLDGKTWDKDGKEVKTTAEQYTTKDGLTYLNGKPFSGTRAGKTYKDGKPVPIEKKPEPEVTENYTTTDGLTYLNGKLFSGNRDGKTYKDGKVVGEGAVKTDTEEAATETAGTTGTTVTAGTEPTEIGKVFADAQKRYGAIDEIFKTNTELRELLEKAMGKVGDPNDDFTLKQFTDLVENTKWFKSNAGPIQKRGFYKRQYEFLTQDLKESDPEYQKKLAELDKTSEYGRGLAETIQKIQEEAIEQGKEIDPTTARALAIEIYDFANEADAVKIRKAVTGAGKFGTAVVGGTAGDALQTLRRVAQNNGFDLDVDFADQKDTWLNAILNGESVDKFSSLIRQRAGQGQNKFVQDLLKNGYDLNGVYGNYINLMSQYFDIPASSIKPTDPLLAKAFTDAGGMKFSDFEALLRTDSRFKGTKQAGQTADIRQSIVDRALALGVTLGDDEIDDVVNNALSMGISASSSLVDGLIRAKFSYAPGKALGGAAGGALASLKATAAANGLDFDKQFGTQAQTWLAKILQGESPDTFKNVIRQTAKLGLPEKVGSLLDLGVDLETIYSPYKNVMASVLEVNPQTIGLDDKTLRSAIGPEKEMTIYDWERSLRKDPRWQYTNNARQEVSGIGLNVLQQLGFQG